MDTGTINLHKLIGAQDVVLGSEKGIFIPYAKNPSIFRGAKGAYVSVTMFRRDAPDTYGRFGFIGTGISNKELREKLTPEQQKELCPIIGSIDKINVGQEQREYFPSNAPSVSASPMGDPTGMQPNTSFGVGPGEDLPI